jgi:hypothetical protein
MAILVVAVVFVLALLVQHRPGAFTSQTCGGVRRDDAIAERRPGNLSARLIELCKAVAPRLPQRLQRMREPKDGTVTSSPSHPY